MDDDFDSVISPEERFTNEGKLAGMEEGKDLGIEDGIPLGYEKGYVITSEIGYIRGCIESWLKYYKKYPDQCKSSRSLKSLEKILLELEGLVTMEDIMQKSESIRLKFKQLNSQMGLKPAMLQENPKESW